VASDSRLSKDQAESIERIEERLSLEMRFVENGDPDFIGGRVRASNL
jgi:hypothetical protein